MAPVDSAAGPPVIPDGLAARVRREGQEGWLNELPDLIVELAERWGLQLETPFSRGPTVSWVAPAGKVDGVRAVLKVGMPHIASLPGVKRVRDAVGPARVSPVLPFINACHSLPKSRTNEVQKVHKQCSYGE